ncbi:hypothetical protein [Kibdelosporangium philippinense]|uniref:hypothetical protein n=1 Tax=Kibdelosporangium philippinense TaxID=211113 RepID=UPI00360A5DDE
MERGRAHHFRAAVAEFKTTFLSEGVSTQSLNIGDLPHFGQTGQASRIGQTPLMKRRPTQFRSQARTADDTCTPA